MLCDDRVRREFVNSSTAASFEPSVGCEYKRRASLGASFIVEGINVSRCAICIRGSKYLCVYFGRLVRSEEDAVRFGCLFFRTTLNVDVTNVPAFRDGIIMTSTKTSYDSAVTERNVSS